ncbi:hypothetical protein GN958_ATG11609 [Phytophthora infestans]|uniref:START domain-containing protein n=1 Tax=Phytophthora infestans TaxID=4787 RepID=A0A8S9UJE0_PHYIN|nr:hypothetical protein GN958_ATG11609 [Phytophthora infestans]
MPQNTPFQRISLSSVNEDELQVITTTLVDANFEQYQEFDGVDSKFWKLVQIKNHIRLYTEKRRKQQADSGPDLYSMLCVGSISGALDDLMSGTVKRANDPSGAALLSTVQEPTMEDPVQSITLKWMDLDVRRRTMGIVKNRDYVYVEATGIKYLPSGGRVGYHFMHSVDIPETHSLPDRVRAKLSVCFFFRQVSETLVSVYAMTMLDPMSDGDSKGGKTRKFGLELSSLRVDHTCITCQAQVPVIDS